MMRACDSAGFEHDTVTIIMNLSPKMLDFNLVNLKNVFLAFPSEFFAIMSRAKNKVNIIIFIPGNEWSTEFDKYTSGSVVSWWLHQKFLNNVTSF